MYQLLLKPLWTSPSSKSCESQRVMIAAKNCDASGSSSSLSWPSGSIVFTRSSVTIRIEWPIHKGIQAGYGECCARIARTLCSDYPGNGGSFSIIFSHHFTHSTMLLPRRYPKDAAEGTQSSSSKRFDSSQQLPRMPVWGPVSQRADEGVGGPFGVRGHGLSAAQKHCMTSATRTLVHEMVQTNHKIFHINCPQTDNCRNCTTKSTSCF